MHAEDALGRFADELIRVERGRGEVGFDVAVLLQEVERFLHFRGLDIAHWLFLREQARKDLKTVAQNLITQRRVRVSDQRLNRRLGVLQSLFPRFLDAGDQVAAELGTFLDRVWMGDHPRAERRNA